MDLPDPPAPEISPEAEEARQWHVALTFAAFGAIYATVHKAIVPITMKFLGTSREDYARLDPFVIFYLALAVWLHFRQRLDKWGSALVGVLVAHATAETVRIILSPNKMGWLVFSKMISAWPLALVGIWMLSMDRRTPRPRVFFAACAVALFVAATWGRIAYVRPPPEIQTATAPVDVPETAAVAEAPPQEQCGASEVRVSAGMAPLATDRVEMRACGFAPSLLSVPNEGAELEFLNTTDHSQTLRLLVFENGRRVTRWNTLLPMGARRKLRVELRRAEIAALISDSDPRLGLTVFVSASLSRSWRIQRSPLTAESADAEGNAR